MSNAPTPDWDPTGAAVLRDQRSAYDAMREECPVAYSDFLGWSLFRHADISAVLADPKTFSSASRHLAVPNGMDLPEHGRYRRVLEPYFAPESMAAFEPRCRPIAARLAQDLLSLEEPDIVRDFAEPFSLQAACAFLGWPMERWDDLLGWTHGNQAVALSRSREAGAKLARELAGYVNAQLQVRRESPRQETPDITSSLMAADVAGQPLSDEEIVSVLRNWIAGHGTVAAAISILVHYLATHQDVQQRLRAEPDLLPTAADEILRADGPLVANRRTTTRDVEIAERHVPAGANLSLIWVAANRDPQAFVDPESVRFDRDPRANLLFGAGIHDCVGAPLARLEMRIALEELLLACAAIALDTAQPPQRAVYPSNGFQRMPIVVA